MDESAEEPAAQPGRLPVTVLDDRDADLLEMLLDGTGPWGRRYHALEESPQDGAARHLAPTLRLDHPPRGHRLVLSDREGVPMALLDVSGTPAGAGPVHVTGGLTPLQQRSPRPFARLRATAGPARAADVVAVATSRPLVASDLAELAATARPGSGGPGAVTLLGLVGHGRPTPLAVLARCLLAAADELRSAGLDAQVRVVPLPVLPAATAHATAGALADVALATGATRVLLPHGEVPDLPAGAVADLPVAVGRPPDVPAEAVARALDRGDPLPPGYAPEAVARELRRLYPPSTARGLVLFLTGLSGSGKSTIAAGVVDALAEHGGRTVTLLDGDVVRTVLSAGLTFSRTDRDLNIRRIGFVAAEVGRHGGTAVCAPIAPYATTREQVRADVERAGAVFLLVHVATPLAVCEARDRKGLYARARAGLLPAFTGVSDPYEAPGDADLRLDASVLSTEACVGAVMDLLVGRGLVDHHSELSAGSAATRGG